MTNVAFAKYIFFDLKVKSLQNIPKLRQLGPHTTRNTKDRRWTLVCWPPSGCALYLWILPPGAGWPGRAAGARRAPWPAAGAAAGTRGQGTAACPPPAAAAPAGRRGPAATAGPRTAGTGRAGGSTAGAPGTDRHLATQPHHLRSIVNQCQVRY